MSDQITLMERTSGQKIVAADQWVQITDVLHRHLEHQPAVLDLILIDLANLKPAYEVAS